MSNHPFTTRSAYWSSDCDALSGVRKAVFIEEQQVPIALEWDGLDEEAIHVIALDSDSHAIGTGRLLPSGQIGRMAVLHPWRNRGVGSALLLLLITLAPARETLFLNAQVTAVDFYKHHGFRVVGPQFLEAGIIHYRMEASQNE